MPIHLLLLFCTAQVEVKMVANMKKGDYVPVIRAHPPIVRAHPP